MPRKRSIEPIGPTTIPGEPMDPKIPPDQAPESDGRASKPKVTPMDEDKNIEEGIEVNET